MYTHTSVLISAGQKSFELPTQLVIREVYLTVFESYQLFFVQMYTFAEIVEYVRLYIIGCNSVYYICSFIFGGFFFLLREDVCVYGRGVGMGFF